MSKRISSLKESPCYKCTTAKECMQKIKCNPTLMSICDNILGDAEFDYHDCGLYIALTCPKMIDES